MITQGDLMISDYVWYDGLDVDGTLVKYVGRVTDIKQYGDAYYVSFERDENDPLRDKIWCDTLNVLLIEPIPITKEILKKNSFKGDAYAILRIDANLCLEYYYHERRLRKVFEGVDEWENHSKVRDVIFQCKCSYIHQMQHAFKMCGIEKEIEL